MKIWEIKTTFGNQRPVSRQVVAEVLQVGAFPSNNVRLPKSCPDHLLTIEVSKKNSLEATQQDVKAKVNVSSGVLRCEWGDLKIEVKELSELRESPAKRIDRWIGGHEIRDNDSEAILWHLFSGQLVESFPVRKDSQKNSMPVSGFKYSFDWSMRKLVLYLPGGDLRTVEMLKEDKVLKGSWEKHQFVLSSKADASFAEALVPTKSFLATIKRDNFLPIMLSILGLWVCFVAFLHFGPVLGDLEETVEEKLSPEYAKVRIEKKKQKEKVESGGGRGGGGVQNANANDLRGGAGYYDEVLVQDRNVLASAVGVLDAFSSLDRKMASAVNTIGAGVAGGKNRARGILAALGNMAGSGGGGTGVGGLGTKGFGGGGGGGTGNGYGTGIGAGVGKGEAGRGVAFEDSSVSIRGALEKSEINAVVDENFAQIRFCYNRALRTNPSLKGKVISNFVIDANGSVSISRISSTTLLSPSVENCIKKKISGWKFPQPRGGGSVTVNYPFLFNRT